MTLRTVSGWEHSSTKQIERVPRGSFGVATYKYTVPASIINRNRAVIAINATSFMLVAFCLGSLTSLIVFLTAKYCVISYILLSHRLFKYVPSHNVVLPCILLVKPLR